LARKTKKRAKKGGGRRYRVLVINWQDVRNPLSGGAEVHCHEIFRRLAEAGHEVTLLCSRFAGAADEEWIDGIRVVRRGGRNWFNFVVPFAYRRLCRRFPFDLVFDDINKIPFFTPLFVRRPLIAIVHHLFGRSIFLETCFLPASYVYLAEKLVPWVYRRVPFVCVSESTRLELADSGLTGTIELLPNGVDTGQYRVQKGHRSRQPLIGYLGRLKKYKSIDHLLRAMPSIRDKVAGARLLIIGDGDHRAELERLAVELGLTNAIEFTGAVSHEAKVAALNRLWLAVNPSPKEGWGLTVIEANACGIPVVAADSPGLRDSVRDQVTGLLYPYGDYGALASQVASLLKNPGRRQKMSRAAVAWATSLSWERSAEIAEQLINRVCSKY